MFVTAAQVIAWLLSIPPLDRRQVEANLAKLCAIIDEQGWRPTCPVITVTGTNGKGTCVHTLSAILQQAGYRVASFTSPHLQSFHERIRINGYAIDDHHFIEAAAAVFALNEHLPQHFFSLLLLMALWFFHQQQVDVILLEVGVGGRLDPCNALDADFLAITSIDLDHQHLLGESRDQIAYEKAGLMRPGQIAVIGETAIPDAIYRQAATHSSRLVRLQHEFDYDDSGPHLHWRGNLWQLTHLPKPDVVLSNVAVALAIIEALQPRLKVETRALHSALQTLQIPGRYQRLWHKAKPILVDVAHNPAAIHHLIARLQRDWPAFGIRLIFGMMEDKAWYECLMALRQLPLLCCYLPPIEDSRALDPHHLASACIEQHLPYQLCPSPAAALDQASSDTGQNELIVVTGSFRLVGAALTWADGKNR